MRKYIINSNHVKSDRILLDSSISGEETYGVINVLYTCNQNT